VTRKRILILGGTQDARLLAAALARNADCDVVLSLAGRTVDPAAQPVPVRSGGFGGSAGLATYLRNESIDLLIDATHPFAEQISRNADAAAQATNIPMFALRRPAWEKAPGDIWTEVESLAEAVRALGEPRRRVFLAVGRQQAFHFATAPQHRYLIRSIEPIDPPLDLPDALYILDAGPFSEERELALLRQHRIDVVVSKNSGGAASYGKIAAARQIGIEVLMIGRTATPEAIVVATVEQALQMTSTLLALANN
jgi:precorrin-6A/cobalt-precorrin-6A reductase